MANKNPHIGSTFESWLDEEGIREEVTAAAIEFQKRRSGVYVLSDEERAAIAESLDGELASDDDVKAFWKRHGIDQ